MHDATTSDHEPPDGYRPRAGKVETVSDDGVDPLVRVTVARADAADFDAYTRRSGKRIELVPLHGAMPSLREGELLGLKRPVAGDATYEEPVIVARPADGPTDTVLLKPAGDRQRHQQRDHVRVQTRRLTMHLDEFVDQLGLADDAAADDPADPRVMDARVLDLSAGGARIEHDPPALEVGSLWQVETELVFEDDQSFTIEQIAEVRWVIDPHAPVDEDAESAWPSDLTEDRNDAAAAAARTPEPAPTRARPTEEPGPPVDEPAVAGLRFMGTRPGTEEAVTRWVFQQQAKWLRVRRDLD